MSRSSAKVAQAMGLQPGFVVITQCLLRGLWLSVTLLLFWVSFVGLVEADETPLGHSVVIDTPHMKASLVSERSHAIPGQPLKIALRLQADEDWHSYWLNPGDTGLPTRIEWQLPEGFQAGEINWPVPERIDIGGMINYGYHGEVWLVSNLVVPDTLDGDSISIAAQAHWLVCREVCIPGQADLQLTLPVDQQGTAARPIAARQFLQLQKRYPIAMPSIEARYVQQDEHLIIVIDGPVLPKFEQAPQLFLHDKEIIQNTQLPKTRWLVQDGRDIFEASFVLDPYASDLPDPLDFVLVVQADQRGGAVIISAKRARSVATALKSIAQASIELTADKSAQAAQSGSSVSLVSPAAVPASSPAASLAPASASSLSSLSLSVMLGFALLGGLILNLMPCVFPVLSLKIVSLVDSQAVHAESGGAHRQLHGLAYTAGVVLSFLIVATVLIALRAAGEQVGWGFQLQSPWFIALLIYILFALGLSLSGVVEFGSALQQLGGIGSQLQGVGGSFATGVLATIVATPCTAPFMGTAMGFALSQPALVALLVFAVMGIGLALPFLLIAFIPALANLLPQPGNWMVKLKELLAFPLYLTVVWLLWVLARQAGSDAMALVATGLVLVAFACWLWKGVMYRPGAWFSKITALVSVVLALLCIPALKQFAQPVEPLVAVGTANASQQLANGRALNYSEDTLNAAIAAKKAVFVNMTADWCITCKVNERAVLSTNKIQSAFADNGIVYLKGDWTNSDARISRYLEHFGRNGVPLYVYYPVGGEPVVLPQILTQDLVLNTLAR